MLISSFRIQEPAQTRRGSSSPTVQQEKTVKSTSNGRASCISEPTNKLMHTGQDGLSYSDVKDDQKLTFR